jgi:hypothetical protein
MFSEALQLDLELAIKEDHFLIAGGNIKNFQITLLPYGFDAKADFWISSDISEDKLFPKFTRPDQIEARLSIQGVYNLPSPAPEPLVVTGPVTWKSVQEIAVEEVKGEPVLFRHYAVHFQDAAQVLWRQHFPTALYEKAKMMDVVNGHMVNGISLRMDWDALEKELPMICLSLGAGLNGASFYDFLMWYVASENGVFIYDSRENTFILSSTKESQGSEVSLDHQEVEEVRVHLPETYRHNIKLLNAVSEKPRSEEITQEQAVKGTHRDVLLRTSIAADFDGRKSLETQKLKNREHEIDLVLKQFPLKTFRPGTFVDFDKKTWSKELFPFERKYRVCEIQMHGRAETQDHKHARDKPFASYNVEMTARLESRDNPHVHLPLFKAPSYPIQVEGKIISEIGEDNDKTYQIYSDKETSQDFYTVRIPLWNREIRIPFAPDFLTGHFYFPAFKHTRVLVTLHYDHAEIGRFLDWGEDVRLPMDTQGNHILFGKNYESQTSIQHIYLDDKPALTIERLSGIDTEIIHLKEGTLILQTKEDEDKKAREESFSVTPRVENARSKLTSENEAATSELTGSFQKTHSEVTGEFNQAMTEVKGQLEAMDAEITGKVNEIQGRVEAAMQQLSEKAAAIKGKAESTKAELKEKIKL